MAFNSNVSVGGAGGGRDKEREREMRKRERGPSSPGMVHSVPSVWTKLYHIASSGSITVVRRPAKHKLI